MFRNLGILDDARQSVWVQRHTEDKVYTSELLQRLEQTSSQETLPKRSLEAISICRLAQRHLVKMVGLDFVQLLYDRWVIDR